MVGSSQLTRASRAAWAPEGPPVLARVLRYGDDAMQQEGRITAAGRARARAGDLGRRRARGFGSASQLLQELDPVKKCWRQENEGEIMRVIPRFLTRVINDQAT